MYVYNTDAQHIQRFSFFFSQNEPRSDHLMLFSCIVPTQWFWQKLIISMIFTWMRFANVEPRFDWKKINMLRFLLCFTARFIILSRHTRHLISTQSARTSNKIPNTKQILQPLFPLCKNFFSSSFLMCLHQTPHWLCRTSITKCAVPREQNGFNVNAPNTMRTIYNFIFETISINSKQM